MKSSQQRKHFKRRLKERFGIYLANAQLDDLVARVQQGEGAFVERQSCRITVFDMEVEGQIARLVYDKRTKELVTAMHPDGPRLVLAHMLPNPGPTPTDPPDERVPTCGDCGRVWPGVTRKIRDKCLCGGTIRKKYDPSDQPPPRVASP